MSGPARLQFTGNVNAHRAVRRCRGACSDASPLRPSPGPTAPCCVTAHEILNLSVLQYLHLQGGDDGVPHPRVVERVIGINLSRPGITFRHKAEAATRRVSQQS